MNQVIANQLFAAVPFNTMWDVVMDQLAIDGEINASLHSTNPYKGGRNETKPTVEEEKKVAAKLNELRVYLDQNK